MRRDAGHKARGWVKCHATCNTQPLGLTECVTSLTSSFQFIQSYKSDCTSKKNDCSGKEMEETNSYHFLDDQQMSCCVDFF